MKATELNHRCKELLEYNKQQMKWKPCCIRYTKWFCTDTELAWTLAALESDAVFESEYMRNIAKIKYCCFCGKNLYESE